MCGRINQQFLKDKLFVLADVSEQLPGSTNIGIGNVTIVQTMN